MATYELLEELRDYVGFGPEDAALLRELAPILEPSLDGIVEHFYAVIEAHPKALAVFEDDAQIERQKVSLRDWMVGIFGGVYDEAYFERRARIGRVHVRIGLDQRYMFAAMNLVRTDMHSAIAESIPATDEHAKRRSAMKRAVDRIIDIEMAIMLEVYAEDYLERARANERLATLGQLAGSIGHELRNPLAVMATSLHLLSRSTEGNAKAARHAQRIGAQVEICGEIISDLLDLARDRPIATERSSPHRIIEDALGLLPKSEVHVEVYANALPEVDVDPSQVRQLLTNLLSNAIEATRGHGSKVELHVSVEAGVLELRVDDEGPGISDEVRARLFEPLFTTRTKGIGLGLALCRRIVEKHDGTISATNRPEGGARFEVHLPCSS